MTLTPLTAIRERAEKARKLVEAATPGPWEKSGEYGIVQTKHITRDLWVIPRIEEDLAFIAASPTIVRELLDTQERLIAALQLAMEQRETVHKLAMPHDCWHFTSQDAAIAAILEPKVTP